jgi:putative peptidoglycan lipid II flippase
MASTLGDLPEAAAFAAASGIPGALFDLFFSAAITGTFIPAYSSAREESEKSARDFFRAFLGISLISSALLALTGAALAPAIISLSAPRLGSETARLAAELLRIIFPSAVFTAVTYTLAGLLQARGSFVLPASVSIASNAFIVLYLLLSRSSFSVHMLAAVYLISWLIQAVTLSVPLLFRRLLPLPTADIRNKHLKKAFSLAPKITAGAFLAPASVLAAAFFCSFASEKAFVIYGYAVGIYTVAAGISVFGVGSTCFPALSESFARGEHEIFAGRLRSALFSATLISIPVFCAVAILAPEGVSLFYERGSFAAGASEACAAALRALSPAIPAYAISEVLYRAFLAAKKPKLTALAALFSLAALVASNVISLVFDGGLTGVCISFTVAECVRALFLFASAKKISLFFASSRRRFSPLAVRSASPQWRFTGKFRRFFRFLRHLFQIF